MKKIRKIKKFQNISYFMFSFIIICDIQKTGFRGTLFREKHTDYRPKRFCFRLIENVW